MATKSPITCHGTHLNVHTRTGGTSDRPFQKKTHPTVLDSSIGKPAQGVKVQLLSPSVPSIQGDSLISSHPIPTHAGVWVGIGSSMTNADGRCLDLLPP